MSTPNHQLMMFVIYYIACADKSASRPVGKPIYQANPINVQQPSDRYAATVSR
jgi:hypothetical protein